MSERQPHVLFLFLGDPSHDRRVQQFVRFFSGRNWKVTLAAGVNRSVEDHYQPIVLSHVSGPRRFLEYRRLLRQFVASQSANVVIACDLYSLSAAAWLKSVGRARLLLYDAREVYTELPTVVDKPITRRVWKSLEKRGLSKTDLIIVTAPHDVDAICRIHRFIPRSTLVRNLPWKQDPPEVDKSILSPLGILPADKVMIYVGGLQEGRGLEILIQSMAALPSNIKLLLVGDGIRRSSLEALVRKLGVNEKVVFAGSRESQEADRLVAACDVGVALIEPVSPSYALALPSKIFEYMAAGLPIVATPLRHVTELFSEEKWMHFVNLADRDSIRIAIQNALEQSEDGVMQQAEQLLAQTSYHFEKDANAIFEVLTGLIKN